ncbi:MAG: hypothetical protein J0I41_20820 [Filimonas sp.]|nr:hypothetical protein [Filimonas sp.]
MNTAIVHFFANSSDLDVLSLRPLSHISMCWELIWDADRNEYEREEGTLAGLLNDLIIELAQCTVPTNYHENEDRLAKFVADNLNWRIKKEKGRWNGAAYESILEQGGFGDINQCDLVIAATGRVQAAIKHGQYRFDDMEFGHKKILAELIAIILYHRS